MFGLGAWLSQTFSVADGVLTAELGYTAGKPPRDKTFKQALADELARMREFLGCD